MFRALTILAFLALSCVARADDPDLLEPTQAFRFSASLIDTHQIEVRYQIAPGYYMYRDKFSFSAEPSSVALGPPQLPQGIIKKDQFFGEMQTYRGAMHFVIPFTVTGAPPARLKLTATSQGCADLGVCYPPQEQFTEINLATPSSTISAAQETSPFLPPASAVADDTATPPAPVQSEDTRIANLFKGGVGLIVISFLGFGLLLAFTPCMFPMVPILSGVLVPHGARLSPGRGFLLSLSFVLGMAITYALAGVAAGLLGGLLSSSLQNPWVLAAFAAVFVVLALSMFGLFELQLPSALQTRLTSASNKLSGGHFAGVFVMGALSALIASPCVAAPLAGALLYIGQSGDYTLGGTALFAMALGMGIPLLVIGASAGALLPHAGPWMETVKRLCGIVLLGVAIYLVSSLLPPMVLFLAWSALFIIAAMFLRAIDPLPPQAPGYQRLLKGIGILSLLSGIVFLIGALSGSRDVLQPLAGLRSAGNSVPHVTFQRIADVTQLDNVIRAAAGKPVLLDFYADWCVSCKEMERDTYSDSAVQQRLSQMVLVQADVTRNLDTDQALLKRFGLFGPPGTIFFDRTGREIPGVRVIGFESPERFKAKLDQVIQR